MAHPFAAHLGQGDLDAAFLADDAAVLHALVLAAQALVVLDRAEDTGAEQAFPFRLEGAVVDRFRLADFTIRPGTNTLRRSDGNLNAVKARRCGHLAKEAHQLVHSLSPKPKGNGRPKAPMAPP